MLIAIPREIQCQGQGKVKIDFSNLLVEKRCQKAIELKNDQKERMRLGMKKRIRIQIKIVAYCS
ncbi:hypothetical protein JCM15579A_12230 [Marinifilum fragile]